MTYDLNYVVLGSIFVFGYFLGSIPFGLILTKISGLGDIRKIGSGNIGATNVLRTGNKKLALFTLLLDGGKGAIAIYLITIISTKVFNNNFDMQNELGDVDEDALKSEGPGSSSQEKESV